MGDDFIMKKYKTNFSNYELQRALHSKDAEAKSVISDSSKWNKLKTNILLLIEKAEKIPVIGNFIDDIECMVFLVDSYIKKEYREIPVSSITAIVASLLYVASPIDLIPDAVPAIGYLDDAAIICLVLNFGIDKDLDKYRNWNDKNKMTAIFKLKNAVVEEIIKLVGEEYVAGIVLCRDNTLSILLNENLNPESWSEYHIKKINVPKKLFDSYNICEESEILNFFDDVIELNRIRWVFNAKKKMDVENKFQWDNYVIREN